MGLGEMGLGEMGLGEMGQNPHEAGAAEMAASHKVEKYVDLSACYIFEPVVVETLGAFNSSDLLNDL